jgi:hypothetical protein
MKKQPPIKTRVIFDITINPKRANDIGNLMAKMDLGISGILYPISQRISFTTTTKVTKKYLKGVEETLRKAYEEDGNTVLGLKLNSVLQI